MPSDSDARRPPVVPTRRGEPTSGAPGVLLTPPTWYSMGHGPQLKNQMASYPFIRTLAAAPAAVGELCHTAVKSLCLIEL